MPTQATSDRIDQLGPRQTPGRGRVAATALTGTLIAALLFGLLRHQTQVNNRFRYQDTATAHQHAIELSLARNIEGLYDLYYPFSLFQDIDWNKFRVMANVILRHHPGMQGIEWAPRVSEAVRAPFVARMRQVFPGYAIHPAAGSQAAPPPAAVHYPVAYAMPYAGNIPAVGFDLGTEAVRAAALQRAMDTDAAAATAKLTLVQGTRQRPGFLAVVPVYRQGAPTATTAERRASLSGFVVGVYVIEDLINAALRDQQHDGMATWIIDRSAPPADRLLYFNDGRGDQSTATWQQVTHLSSRWPVFHSIVNVAGRQWEIYTRVTPWYPGTTPLYWSWAALLFSLGTTVLACTYLLLSGRHAHHRQQAARHLADSRVRLVESEQRYRSLFEHNPDAVYSLDLDHRITSANPGAERLTGFRVADLIGKSVFDFVTPAEQATVAAHLAAATRGEPQNFDVRGVDRAGRPYIVNVTDLPIFVEGHIVGVYGIAKDITQSRQTEEGLRLAANALENTVEGMMITDAAMRIVSVNKAFTHITGFTEQEVIGQSPAILQAEIAGDNSPDTKWQALVETGHWQGEIWGRKKTGEIYPTLQSISAVRDETGAVTHYVGVFNDISESREYQEKLEFLAHHDALTQLPNRVLLSERVHDALARAGRYQGQMALLFIDLDRFKTINDSLGHEVGDQLLREVASRLTTCVRETDTVARQGGDEFIVLLEKVADPQDAAPVAQKILDTLAHPFHLAGHNLTVSASIGIACYPHDGKTQMELLRNADAAMYQAKSLGKNNYQYFAAEMNAQALEHLLMTNNLRAALTNQEFVLYYQPIVDIDSHRIIGAEALIRWQHPQLGLLAPANFIPLAEETGLIEGIGAWAFRTACAQLAAWQQMGIRLNLAINLSAQQFQRNGLLAMVRQALADTGAPADCLKLEVTESMVMRDPAETQRILTELHDMRLAISLDDFGTGYSSLSYLKHFPIDYMKIDRSFVRDIPGNRKDIAIVQAIIALAKHLGMKVIAEGIEAAAQHDLLATEGCDQGQGFYYSRPLPPAEFLALLAA